MRRPEIRWALQWIGSLALLFSVTPAAAQSLPPGPAKSPNAEPRPSKPPASAPASPPEAKSAATTAEPGAAANSEESAAPTPDAAAAEPEGDLVEVVEDTTTAPKAPPKTETERFELHGWARHSFELGFSQDAMRLAEPDATALPYNRFVWRDQLFMRARYSRGDHFEANVSGFLSYAFSEQGPDRSTKTFNLFNGQQSDASFESSLYELYLGFYWKSLDLRVGRQRLAWGRGDFLSPNDVINARDNRDPFVSETELRRIPSLLARADLDLGFGSLQLVLAPIYDADVADVTGSNWAVVQPSAPAVVRAFLNQVSFDRAVAATAPKSDFTDPSVGARFAWSIQGYDFDHYYHYGFDGPFVSQVAGQLSNTNLKRVPASEVDVLMQSADAGTPPFNVRFLRRHHVGTAAVTTVGPFALRLDVAYQSQRVFYREDLLSFASPTFQSVMAVELQSGERENGILVEGLYTRIIDKPTAPLLAAARDTVGFGASVRWKLIEHLSSELRVLWGVEPRTLIVQPFLHVRFDPAVLSIGGLWLGGEENSLGYYFRRNRELFIKAKLSF